MTSITEGKEHNLCSKKENYISDVKSRKSVMTLYEKKKIREIDIYSEKLNILSVK